MNAKRYQLDNYKRFLLNRVTASPLIIEYIENRLSTEDEAGKHSFHKVMIHNWTESLDQLFDTISEYFSSTLIPVNTTTQGDITTFYTSSLNLILKIIKLDFMFPFKRHMFNVDLLFNDKTSMEFFENYVTIEDIVSGVVSTRFTEKRELDLSDFCSDKEFTEKKIHFYKISLLSHFKILMLRMGRDTQSLNLSNNNLSQPPIDILNFFIKGDLTSINLSQNNIQSIQELVRVSSKIEKLWIEGNPLCDEIDASTYVKHIMQKFPRLSELDGVHLNQHGMMFPFIKNYLETPDRRTKMIVEKFLTLYFTHYDAPSRNMRRKCDMFYDNNAKLTVATTFTDAEEQTMPHYASLSRNIMNPSKRTYVLFNHKVHKTRNSVIGALTTLPESTHDPSTFTVDVLLHDKKCLILVVDGVFKERATADTPERHFQFRRTFVFTIYVINANSVYHIVNEMFNLSFANKEQIENSFKTPIRNMNSLKLLNPDSDDTESIIKAYSHLTQLKRPEVEMRLKLHSWDIKEAIKEFMTDLKNNLITPDRFIHDDDDFSDSSSLMDDID